MTNSTPMTTSIDQAVRQVSAFKNWADLKSSLERGYTPTCYPETAAHKLVRRVVVKAGYQVFPPLPADGELTIKVTKAQGGYVRSQADLNDLTVTSKGAYITATRATWEALEMELACLEEQDGLAEPYLTDGWDSESVRQARYDFGMKQTIAMIDRLCAKIRRAIGD
jgi:hypothetical protein